MERTLTKDTVNKLGEKVKLAGWIHNRRDHGQVVFIDLRDRSGLVQIVFTPKDKKLHKLASSLRKEWVVEIEGEVNKRPAEMVNEKIKTGEIEIKATSLKILNEAKDPPFEIAQEEVKEEQRLKYRYLDLRRKELKSNIEARSKIIKWMRDFMEKEDFSEIETPILTKSTPEGARDFLVPSRLHKGEFYALPQAPQQLKQMLMVAGFEKYFQIARCFRDEDLRGDRQPEFTQLDIEMSFVDQEEILNLVEMLFAEIIEKWNNSWLADKILKKKFNFYRMDYEEAIKKYNTDKPDLRENPEDPNELAIVWILNWPLFEWDEEEKRYDPHHHIFTAPQEKDIDLLKEDPSKVHSLQHDLIINGNEIAGGSIRIHQREIQEKVFELVGFSQKEIQQKFGRLLEAFEYGAPPHGGIAFGLDRFLMLLLNQDSIREVIAFPKTGDGKGLMIDTPSEVSEQQLRELHLKIRGKS